MEPSKELLDLLRFFREVEVREWREKVERDG